MKIILLFAMLLVAAWSLPAEKNPLPEKTGEPINAKPLFDGEAEGLETAESAQWGRGHGGHGGWGHGGHHWGK